MTAHHVPSGACRTWPSPVQAVCMESFPSQTLGQEKVIKEQLEMANEYSNWAKEQGPAQFWLSRVSDTNYFGKSYLSKQVPNRENWERMDLNVDMH